MFGIFRSRPGQFHYPQHTALRKASSLDAAKTMRRTLLLDFTALCIVDLTTGEVVA
jgi:hypothetical protein